MQIFGKELGEEVPIVAEIGVNHEGDLDTALALIRHAAEAGADAVKFQSYSPERYASASDPLRVERVRSFRLDEAAHETLARHAEEHGIPFFSTALSEDVIPLLDRLCSVFKIASGDVTFEPVIRAAGRTGKPIILSTGASTVEEIDRAVGWIRDETSDGELEQRLALMHCVSAYPTPIEEANVLSVPFLADRYGLHVGYSNHVIGMEACLAAVALGAALIEVHFTDRKSGREFRDHELSMDPNDLALLARMVPRIRASLGSSGKEVQPSETASAISARKGVIAARDLAAGTVLEREDLMFARPASEIPALKIDSLRGRTLAVALVRGELIPASVLDGA